MIRDPYRRMDVIASSRTVDVIVDDVQLAHSTKPLLVLETGMPPLWYVPIADVDARHLRPSDLRTRCQYKGDAHYWNVQTDSAIYDNLMWAYADPLPASAALAGYVCVTPWSDVVRTVVDGQETACPQPIPDCPLVADWS